MALRARDRFGRWVDARDASAVVELALAPVMVPQDALDLAARWAADGYPFYAHEICEHMWRTCPVEQRLLWQGLAQAGAALCHQGRANTVGARRLAARARQTLAEAATDVLTPASLAAYVAQLDAISA